MMQMQSKPMSSPKVPPTLEPVPATVGSPAPGSNLLTTDEMKARDAERRLGSGRLLSMDEAVSKLLGGELVTGTILVPDYLARMPNLVDILEAQITFAPDASRTVTLKLRVMPMVQDAAMDGVGTAR
jgi:hypothetical protein